VVVPEDDVLEQVREPGTPLLVLTAGAGHDQGVERKDVLELRRLDDDDVEAVRKRPFLDGIREKLGVCGRREDGQQTRQDGDAQAHEWSS
jgi:hypothetical protein